MLDVHVNWKIEGKRDTPYKLWFSKAFPEILDNFNFVYDSHPDFVFYFNRKQIPPKGKFTKIYCGMEVFGVAPTVYMDRCDWAFGYFLDEIINNDRYLRYPEYLLYGSSKNLIKNDKYNPEEILNKKKKFCAFVYSHAVSFRTSLFLEINKYKHVDAPGICCNNCMPVGKYVSSRESRVSNNFSLELVNFLSEYKFSIAAENILREGYTSEKIYLSMQANCVPIYYGNPRVDLDFNVKSFINISECNLKKVVDIISEIDRSDDLYLKILQEPWFPENRPTKYADPNRMIKFLKKVFTYKVKRNIVYINKHIVKKNSKNLINSTINRNSNGIILGRKSKSHKARVFDKYWIKIHTLVNSKVVK